MALPKKILVLLLTVFCLWGCSQKRVDVENEQVLFISNMGEPEYLDCGLAHDTSSAMIVTQLNEGLFEYDPKTLEPTPALAREWKVSDDQKTYTFFLRKDAKFSDGTPITAHDFVYSWRRILDPATASVYASFLYVIKGGQAFNIGKTQDPKSLGLKALDDYTFQITLVSPTPYITSFITFYTFRVVNKKAIDSFGERWTRPENHVSSGPFKLVSWEPNEKVVIVPNPHYWNRKNVKLKKVVFYSSEERETQLKLYEGGKSHYVQRIPATKTKSLKENPGFQSAVQMSVYNYVFNTEHPVLKDPRVRQALSLAIDREQLTKILGQDDKPAVNYTPRVYKGYNPPKMLRFDPEEARKKLAEAGFSDPKTFPKISLTYNTSENHKLTAEVIQHMWKVNLGIEVALLNKEWKAFLKTLAAHDFEIARHGWSGDYNDPNTFLELNTTNHPINYANWSNAKYDDLIKKAAVTTDQKKRMAFFREAETIILEELPLIPLFHNAFPILINPKVKGMYANSKLLHPLRYVYLEDEAVARK